MLENMPQDAHEKSLWVETAIASPDCPRIEGQLDADVLIVGAGFTGLSSALHLVERGVSVVLLEAANIGFGGSGRNAGLVNAGIWKTPRHVNRLLGSEAGARFNRALRDTPALVFDLVERHAMQCQAARSATVHVAHNANGMSYLRDRCSQLQEIGAAVELLDGDATRALSGSPAYCHGGILDPTAGTIQPLGYVRELARCAIEQGAALYQQSALQSLQAVEGGWLASTASGQVKAAKVILATNAYADAGSCGVRESTLPVCIFHFATAPLPAELTDELIAGRQGLWDTHTLLTSSRIDADGRLVMSFPGRLHGAQRALRRAWATRRRNFLYPQTRGISWEYFWTGRIGVTSDNLLRVQEPAHGLFAPAGYNGRGIGTGTAMGKYLAELIVSGARADFPFPLVALQREKWRRARTAYYDYGTLAMQLASQRL